MGGADFRSWWPCDVPPANGLYTRTLPVAPQVKHGSLPVPPQAPCWLQFGPVVVQFEICPVPPQLEQVTLPVPPQGPHGWYSGSVI